jgi:hypothetical protein
VTIARTFVAALAGATAGGAYADTPPPKRAETASVSDDTGGGAPGQVIATQPVAPRRELGVGYFRGTGLGYFGASLAKAWTSRVTPQLHVFGFFDDGSRGFAVVPAVKLSFLHGPRSSPFIAGGVQYLRMWFGDAAGGGFGGYGSFGYSLRFEPGIELELGVGLHLKQTIRGSDGVVSVAQRPTFGPHWDAGIRCWF